MGGVSGSVTMMRDRVTTMLIFIIVVALLSPAMPAPGSQEHKEVVSEVRTALAELAKANGTVEKTLLEQMSPKARASLASFANVNVFSQRRVRRQVEWPKSEWSL